MRRFLTLVPLIPILFLVPSAASAQLRVEGRGASLTIGGRVHAQYSRSSVDGDGDEPDAVDDFFFRRARIEVDARVSDFLDGRAMVDFATGSADLTDAYLRLTFDPAFRIAFGQFKRAFSIFELASSTELLIIERDGRIEGLSDCPGVESVCTFSRMTEALEVDDRDIGVRAEGRLGERVEYMATLTNGEGKNTPDVNDAKSVSVRVAVEVAPDVVIAGFAGSHDYLDENEDTERARALGADLEVGTFRDGFHLLAGVVGGDNWLAGPDADFLTTQALASYYVPLGGRLAGIEPLLRASWTRPAEGESAVLLTPGLLLYVQGRNAIGFNLDRYDPAEGPSEWSFKAQVFLYF